MHGYLCQLGSKARARMADPYACKWLTELLPRVTALACESGRTILAAYQDLNPQVEYKLDHSPVTHADLVSHHNPPDRACSLNAPLARPVGRVCQGSVRRAEILATF